MVRLGLESDLYNGEIWENLLLTDPRLEKLSANLKSFFEGKRGASNLITFDDNLLCIWDNHDQQIYCLLLRDFKLVNVQNLIPTNAPLFDVYSLIMAPDGRYLALQGTRGINIMELPRKFGPLNAYEGGKSSILCRTNCLAERFFVCNQQITILETRWHPGSPSGTSHISILTNDDCIRIYDISIPQVCLQEIKLTDPYNGDMKYSSSKFASSLGQMAVSFDFGLPIDKRNGTNNKPPTNSSQNLTAASAASSTPSSSRANTTLIEEDSCVWPIYVLRGNGDVLLVYNDLHNIYLSKRILGPLTMRPPAEDNYGVDASSIICLDCAPPLLAIATSSGMIYHCLALDNLDLEEDEGAQALDIHTSTFISETDENLISSLDDPNTVHSRPQSRASGSVSLKSSQGLSRLFLNPPTLFVVESLELVLSLTSVTDQDDTSHLRLIRPAANPQIYFCSHEAGIHIVNIPFLNRLKASMFTSLDETDQSIVEHLICTKPISSPSSCIPMCIPLGVALVARRGFFSVAVLLSTGEILTQRLSPITYNVAFIDESESKTNQDESVSFSVHISQILKRSMNAPHIKSESNNEPSKSDCLQLLLNTTDILRKEYIAKMERATEVITKRASTLVANKKLQLEEIEKLLKEKDSIIESISRTSSKFDETLEKQELLSQRMEKILESLQTRQNHLSEAEKTCQKELDEIARSIEEHRARLDQVQLKFKYQNELKDNEAAKDKRDDARRPGSTSMSHKLAVKKILTSQSEDIQQLVSQVNTLKKHCSQIKLLT